MAREESRPEWHALAQAYRAATVGRKSPTLAMVSGGVLNQLLDTTVYEAGELYLIAPDRLQRMERTDGVDS